MIDTHNPPVPSIETIGYVVREATQNDIVGNGDSRVMYDEYGDCSVTITDNMGETIWLSASQIVAVHAFLGTCITRYGLKQRW